MTGENMNAVMSDCRFFFVQIFGRFTFVTSLFLYACESWTYTAELQRKIQAMEMRCYRKILHISYKDHVTKEEDPAGPSDHTRTI